MKRSPKDYISWKALRHVAYLPLVVFSVKNWFEFLSNYLGFSNRTAIYNFRNGISIATVAVTDVATIMDIFFRKDYGNPSDNATVLDIGANIGVYAIFAATRSKNTKVFAFEPAPTEFQALSNNIHRNNLEKKIAASPIAVTGKDETRILFLNGGPHNSLYDHWKDAEPAEVTCESLEKIFEANNINQCDMLKMDCEGSEFEILQSTPKNIFEKIAAIRMEYHCPPEAPMTPDELSAFLKEKGYRIIKREAATDDRGIMWAKRDDASAPIGATT